MTPPGTADKASWRRWAQAVRAELDVPTWSAALVTELMSWEPYQRARHVLTYLAFGDEPDLTALTQDPTKRFYVSRTWPGSPELSLHVLGSALERHPYGYLQPAAQSPSLSPDRIDLALVPGLCFAVSGGRLGYGGGYYDRLLPTLGGAVPRVGVSAEALVVPALPLEAHDARISHIATERGVRPTA